MEGLLLAFLLGHPSASWCLCLQKPVFSYYCWSFFIWNYWADRGAVMISKTRKLKIPWGEGRLLLGWTGPANLQSIFSVYPHFHTFDFPGALGLMTMFCKFALRLFWLMDLTLIFYASVKRWDWTIDDLEASLLPIAEIPLEHLNNPYETLNSGRQGLHLWLSSLYPSD